MSDQVTSAAFHRTERSGSPALRSFVRRDPRRHGRRFSVMPRDQAGTLIIGLLALLAVVGIFALFGYAVGIFNWPVEP